MSVLCVKLRSLSEFNWFISKNSSICNSTIKTSKHEMSEWFALCMTFFFKGDESIKGKYAFTTIETINEYWFHCHVLVVKVLFDATEFARYL